MIYRKDLIQIKVSKQHINKEWEIRIVIENWKCVDLKKKLSDHFNNQFSESAFNFLKENSILNVQYNNLIILWNIYISIVFVVFSWISLKRSSR